MDSLLPDPRTSSSYALPSRFRKLMHADEHIPSPPWPPVSTTPFPPWPPSQLLNRRSKTNDSYRWRWNRLPGSSEGQTDEARGGTGYQHSRAAAGSDEWRRFHRAIVESRRRDDGRPMGPGPQTAECMAPMQSGHDINKAVVQAHMLAGSGAWIRPAANMHGESLRSSSGDQRWGRKEVERG